MNRWIAVTRALPTTFAVYVTWTVVASLLGLSLGLELERTVSFPLGRPLARVDAIEGVVAMAPLLRAKAVDAGLAAALLAILSPWLSMAWLTSLSAWHGPGSAFRSGGAYYTRALLCTLLVLAGGALLLAPWAFAAYGAHLFLAPRANDRVHDLAILVALSPSLVALLVTGAWHDLAHARCLTAGPVRSALASLSDAIRPSILLRYALWLALGLAGAVAGQIFAVRAAPGHALSTFVVVAIVQAGVLGRAVLRSAWLVDALRCVDARPSVAPNANRPRTREAA